MSRSIYDQVLWMATVGGNPEPIVKSLVYWSPEKVIFLPSSQTASQVESDILPPAKEQGFAVSSGQYECIELPNPQDLAHCVAIMAENLNGTVRKWRERGSSFGIVVDWTGGTKNMSAALALVSHKWENTRMSYVGGTTRTDKGVGIVQSGKEIIIEGVNAWEMLGYRWLEDAVAAYNHGAFAAGADILERARRQVDTRKQSLKSQLSTLAKFLRGVDAWDKCQYGEAKGAYEHCQRNFSDLRYCLSQRCGDELQPHIDEALVRLEELAQNQGKRTRLTCDDLLANAGRRQAESRYVDAVARLYHVVEALGQVQLEHKWGIDASRANLDGLPLTLQECWRHRAADSGTLKLGLQDVYAVLQARNDPLGQALHQLGWDARESPLSRRNESIAGHGFAPVKEKDCQKLWAGALKLAGLEERDLFKFPPLAIR